MENHTHITTEEAQAAFDGSLRNHPDRHKEVFGKIDRCRGCYEVFNVIWEEALMSGDPARTK